MRRHADRRTFLTGALHARNDARKPRKRTCAELRPSCFASGLQAASCATDDVKRGYSAALDHQRSRGDRLVAAEAAGLHLEAKLLHSGSVNLHSVALFASNPRTSSYGSVSVACGSSDGVGSVVLAGAAARARPDCRSEAAVTDCG